MGERRRTEKNGCTLTTIGCRPQRGHQPSTSRCIGVRIATRRMQQLIDDLLTLSALETDHGLTICSLGVTENADATLNVAGAVSNGTCTG